MNKFLSGLGMALVLVAAKLIWNVVVVEPSIAELDPVELAAEVDAWVEEDLSAESSADAVTWLGQSDNRLYEGDAVRAQDIIDALGAAGASDIWFVGVERMGKVNVADEIAIRLPEDPAARAAVFEVYDGLWDDGPTPDVGQEYLTYVFDNGQEEGEEAF